MKVDFVTENVQVFIAEIKTRIIAIVLNIGNGEIKFLKGMIILVRFVVKRVVD